MKTAEAVRQNLLPAGATESAQWLMQRVCGWPCCRSLVVDLVLVGCLAVEFVASQSAERVSRLMKKYADQLMDLADACLVVMAEQWSDSLIVTLDARDFAVYRRHEREVVPHISPPGRWPAHSAGAGGHEDRRLHDAARGGQPAQARFGTRVGLEQLERVSQARLRLNAGGIGDSSSHLAAG